MRRSRSTLPTHPQRHWPALSMPHFTRRSGGRRTSLHATRGGRCAVDRTQCRRPAGRPLSRRSGQPPPCPGGGRSAARRRRARSAPACPAAPRAAGGRRCRRRRRPGGARGSRWRCRRVGPRMTPERRDRRSVAAAPAAAGRAQALRVLPRRRGGDRGAGQPDQLPSTMSAGASVAGLVTSVASETAVWATPLPSRSNCSSPEALV